MSGDFDRLLSVEEVQERLGGLSRSYLYELWEAGEGPIYVKLGRRRLVRQSDLSEFIEGLSG